MPRRLVPQVAKHVGNAISSGRPYLLNRVDSLQARANRRFALRGLGRAGRRRSWDEYPFASSAQGGKGASVASVPLSENLAQGGLIGAAYRLQDIKPGDCYWVIVF